MGMHNRELIAQFSLVINKESWICGLKHVETYTLRFHHAADYFITTSVHSHHSQVADTSREAPTTGFEEDTALLHTISTSLVSCSHLCDSETDAIGKFSNYIVPENLEAMTDLFPWNGTNVWNSS